MNTLRDFLGSEAGVVEADTLVLSMALGVVFFALFAFSGAGRDHSLGRLSAPGASIGDGFRFGDTGPRLPQVGPLYSRR